MMRISFLALVIFVTVECAPQRRPPLDQDVISKGPIFVKGLLSQIHELRNNIQENRQRLVGSILEPVGRIGRPGHDHRKGGRPNGKDEDAKLNQSTQIPTDENNQSIQNKRKGGKPNMKNEDAKLNQRTQIPTDENTQSTQDTTKKEDPKHAEKEEEPPKVLPPRPKPAGLPPPPSGLTTEDWSQVVVPSKDQGVADELKRKIIGAPCLGGITANGDCRPSFD